MLWSGCVAGVLGCCAAGCASADVLCHAGGLAAAGRGVCVLCEVV